MATQKERELALLRDADVAGIGSHCSLDTCKQLDFLPFVCESCKETFCLDHRTETAHSCRKAGTWLSSLRPALPSATTSATNGRTNPQTLLAAPCAFGPKCKTLINTPAHPGVNCPTCRKQYCLAHRLSDSHDCQAPPLPASQIAQVKAKGALMKFKAWSNTGKGGKFGAGGGGDGNGGGGILGGFTRKLGGGNAAAVMKMKKEAKGDEKIPVDERVYLYVEAEARTTTSKLPRGTFWYSKYWSVGRVLDIAAKNLQITNLNNQDDSEEKRLRIFHVEGGRVLSFSEKIGDIAVNGNTIVLLRGLQMPDLLQ